ncbi:MAG: 23S rRNA (adenine(2503)-C(2))-methyltransferase RlmN [Desulfobacterales bacterium]
MKPSTPITNDIKDLTKDQLSAWLESQGMPAYRATQIFKWVYQRQEDDFGNMTDLGKDTRTQLANRFTIGRLHIKTVETSKDRSRKFLFSLSDGNTVESVLIPEKDHYTLCISSQVGCAQGCRFCLTAKGGLKRNLTTGEIIAQVRDIAATIETDRRLSNIVFMGMGEPLANYQHVVSALGILTDRNAGFGFPGRRITVSTAGVVPRLIDFGRNTRDLGVNLAISLNATDNRTRSMLMPINRAYPIEMLLATCCKYPLKPGRSITIEYVLMAGVNDSVADATRLADLLRPFRSKINLIPFNSHDGCDFKRPDDTGIEAFRNVLVRQEYTVMTRNSKGQDISAACGQLSL